MGSHPHVPGMVRLPHLLHGDRQDPMPEIIDVKNDPAWDDAIAGCDGQLFQSRPWMASLSDAFEFAFQAAVVRDESGAIVAGVPFVRLDDIRGRRTVVLPFSDYTIPLVTDAAPWDTLIEPILAFGDPVIVQTAATGVVAADERFEADLQTVRHSIELDADLDELMARCGQQPRRHIRKAEAAGLKFRMAESIDEVRAFYDLHFGVRKYKHQLLCQPFTLFESLWEQFMVDDQGGIVLGFDGETVAGGCLLLEAGDTMYYKYSASHPDYRSKGISHGAVRAAMEYGLAKGSTALDLGRSDIDQPGLIDFKRRFGAVQSDLTRFCAVPVGAHVMNDAAGSMLSDLTALFCEESVDDALTVRAGDLVYRYFA